MVLTDNKVALRQLELANAALVSASRRWLDAHPETTALRRVIVENVAGVERALAAQARDGRE